jgi:hypothetical protein
VKEDEVERGGGWLEDGEEERYDDWVVEKGKMRSGVRWGDADADTEADEVQSEMGRKGLRSDSRGGRERNDGGWKGGDCSRLTAIDGGESSRSRLTAERGLTT